MNTRAEYEAAYSVEYPSPVAIYFMDKIDKSIYAADAEWDMRERARIKAYEEQKRPEVKK